MQFKHNDGGSRQLISIELRADISVLTHEKNCWVSPPLFFRESHPRDSRAKSPFCLANNDSSSKTRNACHLYCQLMAYCCRMVFLPHIQSLWFNKKKKENKKKKVLYLPKSTKLLGGAAGGCWMPLTFVAGLEASRAVTAAIDMAPVVADCLLWPPVAGTSRLAAPCCGCSIRLCSWFL